MIRTAPTASAELVSRPGSAHPPRAHRAAVGPNRAWSRRRAATCGAVFAAVFPALLGCDAQRFESMRADAGAPDAPVTEESATGSLDAGSTDAMVSPRPDASAASPDDTSVDTASDAEDSDASEDEMSTRDEGAATSDPSTEPSSEEAGAIHQDAQATAPLPDWDAASPETDGASSDPELDASGASGADGSSLDPLDGSVPGVVIGDASDCDADASCGDGSDSSTNDSGHDAAADAAVDAGPPVDPSDECPKHPEQTLRGECGCGFDSDPVCTLLEEGLTHRYRFDGEGQTAFDSVGDADGEILGGAELDDAGSLELDGLDDYVSLPTNVPLESDDVTLEAWLTWHGGDDWQRIFDFGSLASNGAELVPKTYLYLSPRGGAASGKQALLFAHSTNGSGNTAHLHGDAELPIGQMSHVAVVINTGASRVALYADGTRLGSADFDHDLSDFAASINSLGRSIFDDDPYLDATIHEFRIYGRSLNESQVQKSYALGPDTTYSQAE